MINTDHTCLITAADNLKIWRYIDFNKFESILKNNALFFCRADRFADPFEGSLPRREFEFRNNQHEGEKGKQNILGFEKTHKGFKRANVISCWQISQNENEGMWRLYLKSNKGLAIKSSVSDLKNAFQDSKEEISISKIRYIDYENGIWYHETDYPEPYYNFITPLVHKRIEFQHENELRLFHHIEDAVYNEEYWSNKPFEIGMMIPINVSTLISEIVLSPTSDDIIMKELELILNKYGLKKNIRKSTLSSSPNY